VHNSGALPPVHELFKWPLYFAEQYNLSTVLHPSQLQVFFCFRGLHILTWSVTELILRLVPSQDYTGTQRNMYATSEIRIRDSDTRGVFSRLALKFMLLIYFNMTYWTKLWEKLDTSAFSRVFLKRSHKVSVFGVTYEATARLRKQVYWSHLAQEVLSSSRIAAGACISCSKRDLLPCKVCCFLCKLKRPVLLIDCRSDFVLPCVFLWKG
jgi:hypothetical protein